MDSKEAFVASNTDKGKENFLCFRSSVPIKVETVKTCYSEKRLIINKTTRGRLHPEDR